MSEYLKFGIQKIINGISGIFIIYILTKNFDSEDYGKYVIILTYSLALANVIYQWQVNIIARFWQKDKISINAFVRQNNKITFIAIIIILIFSTLFWGDYLKEIIAITFTAVAVGMFMLQQQIKNSESNFKEYRAISNVRNIFLLLGILLAVNITNEIHQVSFVLGIACMFAALLYKNNDDHFLDRAKNGEYLTYGKHFFIMSALTVVIDYFDKIFISYMEGMTSLGKYAIIQTILQQSVGAIMSVMYTYKFPAVLKCFDERVIDSSERKIKEMNFLVLYTGLLASFLLYEVAIFYLKYKNLNYDHEYNILILLLLSSTYLACFKGYVIDSAHVLMKNSKAILISTLVTALISIVLNPILIWKFGNIGAALSSVIAFTVGAFGSWLIRLNRSLVNYNIFIFPFFLILSLGFNVGIDFLILNNPLAFGLKFIIYFIPLMYLLTLRHE